MADQQTSSIGTRPKTSRLLVTRQRAVIAVACVIAAIATTRLAGAQAFEIYPPADWFFLAKYEYNPKENFEVTPRKAVGTIPADVRALSGKKMMLYGILTPLDFKDGYATKLILVATVDVCGFGNTPRINEWMDVTMAPGQKARIQAAPGLAPEGTVYGTFTIKEVIDGEGKVLSLYHMVADKIQ